MNNPIYTFKDEKQRVLYPWASMHCKGCYYSCYKGKWCYCMKYIERCDKIASCTPKYK